MPVRIRKERTNEISKYYWTNDDYEKSDELLIYEINRKSKTIKFIPPESYNLATRQPVFDFEFIGFTQLPVELHEKGYIKSGGSYYLYKLIESESIKTVIVDSSIKTKLNKNVLYLSYNDFSKFVSGLQTAINESKREKNIIYNSFIHNINPKKYSNPEVSFGIKEKRIIESLDENIIPQLSPENVKKIEEFYLSLIEKKYKVKEKKSDLLRKNYTSIKSKVVSNAIDNFESLINDNATENELGKFLLNNLFVIDSKYIKSIPEINVMLGGNRRFDFGLIDFDYNLDIFEIKRPNTKLIETEKDHGNYFQHSDLIKSVVQAEKYLFNAEIKKRDLENDLKREFDLDNDISLSRPNAFLIIGHSKQLDNDYKKEDFKIIRKSYKNIQILLYDEILNRLKNLLLVLT